MSKYLVMAGSLLPVAAFAQSAIDVGDAVDQLGTIPATILAVGGALLIAAAVAVAVKWAKATIFS